MNKSHIKHGVKLPRAGSINRLVWDISQAEFEKDEPLLRKRVLKHCIKAGIHPQTASTEHCMWRRYAGLVNNRKKGKTMSNKVLVVLSGGQDSTTCLFWAKQRFEEVHAITFDYGQRHSIEIEAAGIVAARAGVASHEVVKVPNCLISMSPLTSPAELEKYENPEQMEATIGNRRELTFVPMRNALFLTIAANRAEALGIPNLVTGVCQMDNANYDDCRDVFIDAASSYINTALGHDHRGTIPITIHTPLMYLSKAETVMMAFNTPGCWESLAWSHTSYDGKYPPIDMNHANVLRADGFEKAGLPDPLVLRAVDEGLMDLPNGANYSNNSIRKAQSYVR